MSYRGATLRLNNGRASISTADVHFPLELGYGENTEFLRFFVLAYTKLLCDSPLKESHGDKPVKVYFNFLKKLTSTHLAETIKLYASYSHEILSNEYATGGDSTTRVFHSFMLDTPVFKEYHTWLRTGRPELLKFVLSFLLFGKKLEYEDPEFDATAFRGWLEVEERLRTLVLDDDDVDGLSNIIAVILPPLQVDNLYPKFGPGKVAERGVGDVIDKLGNLSLHPRIAFAFERERPGRSWENGFGVRQIVGRQGERSRDCGRQRYVWKDIHKSRSIGMEPNLFMYYQQEVMRWVVNSMSQGLISRFVNLADQANSQDAAVHGSLYFSTDTIDLSSASDSVSVELVRRIFPRDYLYYLLATRTSKVELPDGRVVQLHKFAPMGSALCFPAQCITFTAVCIRAAIVVRYKEDAGKILSDRALIRKFILTSFHRKRSEHTPFTGKFEPPVVYGDDIAVDTRTTDEVISTLNRLGFTVNRSKSFTGSQSFRESCGVFAFEGQDVTPVLFRIPLIKVGRIDAKLYASIIGSINWANDNKYHHYASFLMNALKDVGLPNPIPFTGDKRQFGIFTLNKKRVEDRFLRYNADWQVWEEKQQWIGPRSVAKKADHTWECEIVARYDSRSGQLDHRLEKRPANLEAYRYDQWWRSRMREHTLLAEQARSSRIRPQETRLVPGWARYE